MTRSSPPDSEGLVAEWRAFQETDDAYLETLQYEWAERLADALQASQQEVAGLRATFEAHTKAVDWFLGELYAVMVDPCADGTISVAEVKNQLLAAALLQREDLSALAAEREKVAQLEEVADGLEGASKTWMETMKENGDPWDMGAQRAECWMLALNFATKQIRAALNPQEPSK